MTKFNVRKVWFLCSRANGSYLLDQAVLNERKVRRLARATKTSLNNIINQKMN